MARQQLREPQYVIGENIRALRLEAGKSIADLLPRGWSRAYWNDLERGEKTASLQRLHDIALILSKALKREIAASDLVTEQPRSRARELAEK